LKLSLDFGPAEQAVTHFSTAAQKAQLLQSAASGDLTALNRTLRQAEADFIAPGGLPNRPWYKHTIYAPGEYTGYAAVVIPGVNEALEAKDAPRAATQLITLTQALDRAAKTLDSAH